MIVIPALDLRAGLCTQAAAPGVAVTGFHSSRPLDVGLVWERLGFRRLHVMDLDAIAASARPGDAVRDLLGGVPLSIQVGGAIGSGDRIDELVADGAAFVALGPRALAEPQWLEGTASSFPGRLIVATRIRGRLLGSGSGAGARSILDLIDDLNDIPLGAVLVAPEYRTDGIASEDLPAIEDAADASEHPLLLAGGVRSPQDLRALADRGVAGVVVGTALYTGQLDPRAIAEEFGE